MHLFHSSTSKRSLLRFPLRRKLASLRRHPNWIRQYFVRETYGEPQSVISLPRYQASPLEEIVLIRDSLWFGSDPNIESPRPQLSLVKYLRNLTTHYLDNEGRPTGETTQDYYNNDRFPRARLRWSWLCRAIPPDLLLAAHGLANADGSPFPLSPMVQRLLQKNGFAELHLHLGAAPDFALIWANFMRALAVEEMNEDACESPGASFDDGRKLGKWVMWAAVARLVLAEWLFGSDRDQHDSKLLDFSKASFGRRLDAGLTNDLLRLTSELSNGREEPNSIRFSRARTLYRLLIHPFPLMGIHGGGSKRLHPLREPENRREVFEIDPLAFIVSWNGARGSSPESIFVKKSLRFIEEGDKDGDYTRLFWQIIRIRCLLYRHLVLRPLTPGLQWFVRSYSRISPVRRSLSETVLMDAAIRQSGIDVGLKSLEVRLGTEESESKALNKIRRVNGLVSKPVPSEVGAVFHFSRDRGGGWKNGVPNAHGLDHSYPGIPRDERIRTRQDVGNPSGYRFSRFYSEKRRHAQALVTVLRGFPRALRTVRGIDLCTDEAGVPIWVMAPLVRWVRETGQGEAINLQNRGVVGISPPRTTVHAGEDFVHLLTGLRRLDEAIQYLGLQEGDRIGHGLALGLDPVKWFERAGRIVQTREERLFDLVWEWGCYANRGVDVESARLAYLESAIARLSHEMFEGSSTPEELIQFVKGLHCEHELKTLGFPDGARYQTVTSTCPARHENKSRILIEEYLRSTTVWKKGRDLETIMIRDLSYEIDSLCNLQSALRQKVGTLGLTVEVNPSSNLLISGLGLLEDHPIWRLSQPLDDISPLSVCIGSDDPLTFATNLPHEYQLLFDTMVLAGQSHEVALGWLDKSRESGMQSRFTLPRSITKYPKELHPSLFQVPPTVPPP